MATLTGNFRFHPSFHSQYLPDDRDVMVYLPPGYEEDLEGHYPVFYFQDGQNVFDAETAFGGVEWCADETAEDLIHQGAIPPIIMVGVYNTGESRIHEYTPTSAQGNSDGKASLYTCMLVEELKPFIDREYRTIVGPEGTGIGGSSLGGLVTLYIGLSHPEIFGKLAVMSPSIWWDHGVILQIVHDLTPHPRFPDLRPKVWLDMGTEEGSRPRRMVHDARMLRDVLLKKGWKENVDLAYHEDHGARHTEGAWANRLPDVLKFLFGPGQ